MICLQGSNGRVEEVHRAGRSPLTCRDPFHVCVETLGHCILALQAPQGASLLHLVGQFLLQVPVSFCCRVEEHGKGRVCTCLAAACV